MGLSRNIGTFKTLIFSPINFLLLLHSYKDSRVSAPRRKSVGVGGKVGPGGQGEDLPPNQAAGTVQAAQLLQIIINKFLTKLCTVKLQI